MKKGNKIVGTTFGSQRNVTPMGDSFKHVAPKNHKKMTLKSGSSSSRAIRGNKKV